MRLINGRSLILPPPFKWSVSGLCFLKCSTKVEDPLRPDGLLLWRKASMKSVFVAILNISVEAQTHPMVLFLLFLYCNLRIIERWYDRVDFQLGTLSIGQYIASS